MGAYLELGCTFPVAQTRIVYQWLRFEQLDQWWHWLFLALLVVAALGYVLFWYRKDSREHFRPIGWSLTIWRLAALFGLLLIFFQLERRTEQRIVRDSRVAVLVDTSMSMTLAGTPSAIGLPNSLSRSEEVNRLISQSDFLERLSQQHQVSVYRFDQLSRPTSVAALSKVSDASETAEAVVNTDALEWARLWCWVGALAAATAMLLLLVAWAAQILGFKDWYPGSWLLFAGTLLGVAAFVLAALAYVPNPQYSWAVLFGADMRPSQATEAQESTAEEAVATLPEDWAEALAANGTETHLGDAIKFVLDREASNPLAGIVIFSDGRSNAGVDPRELLSLTQMANVPLYVVGVGSAQSPNNLELVEIDLPKRLYPGDRFSMSVLIAGSGFAGQQVTLQILAGEKDAPLSELGIETEEQVLIEEDGVVTGIDFQLEPKPLGDWQYAAKLIVPEGDANAEDNVQTADVQVIERKNRVLIFAGGPTREYQFVRNLLYRDRDVESHVLLQTATVASSQEAQEILSEFPAGLRELSNYDAIVAFDADWTQVPDSSLQALERWIAEQAGGLIMIAGSVEMPKWTSPSAAGVRADVLRSLSPVVLERRGSALLASGRIESANAWPLELTADGRQSEFLWLTDEPKSSLELWGDFQGVYSFYSAYELKPGAKSLLTFSDPTAAVDGQQPVYMASQYYGAGRTLFIGGSELWRIRSLGDAYFDRLYTKLVRWVSQGRLLLDSDRGVLLADREQALLGDQVVLRAVLKDERFEPLVQSEVIARLIDPQGLNTPLSLRPLADGSQPGVYTGQFPVLKPGEYTAQLQLGGLGSEELLTASVKARVPALEMQRAERNDSLLNQLAVESGGAYWRGVENATTKDAENASILESIQPQDQVAYLPGAADQAFQLRWRGWLMALIAGCLTLEWLTRRLHRLA
ncbi:MAG: VWA domain-containing protein [bacterium]|nr:VWA domain-containing protein [bacterium]